MNNFPNIPFPTNEPVKSYAPGSEERKSLKAKIKELRAQKLEIPMIIGGKEIKTGDMGKCVEPHNHKSVLAEYHKGGEKEVNMAIEAALEARKQWSELSWEHRASIFLKAAELLATKYRDTLNAATMLGQSKNAFQAEIDSACELIDFLRHNAYYLQEIYKEQPMHNSPGIWNRVEYRPLEGFIFAITPFNFTAIAGNLPTAPAFAGNVALWKPASTAVYSGYFLMKLFKEAGLPDGVINFLPGSGSKIGNPALASEHLAGIHFTGSTGVFQHIWNTIGNNIKKYKTYPRIVGETGGKDFIFAHKSADIEALSTALVRGAFEYQGQKCSACSRAYIPKSIWPKVKELVGKDLDSIKMGPTDDFTNFINAVIDESSFDNCKSYIDHANEADDAEIIFGGKCDKSEGYFVEPTVIVAKDPHYKSMEEEIFGPILTIYVYEDEKIEDAIKYLDETSIYALTGAIFSQDRYVIDRLTKVFRQNAGNFYINDKPTGAVVGQQPFGGARGSGTNDKAGAPQNLMRWLSTRTIKENFNPPVDYRYPFLGEDK